MVTYKKWSENKLNECYHTNPFERTINSFLLFLFILQAYTVVKDSRSGPWVTSLGLIQFKSGIEAVLNLMSIICFGCSGRMTCIS